MKKRNFLNRAIFVAIFCLFFSYVGYQVYSMTSTKVDVIDAVMLSAEDKITTDGVFIRQEHYSQTEINNETELLVADGTKVAKGQTIAVTFPSATARDAYVKIKEIDDNIKSLNSSYAYATGGVDAFKLSGDITAAIGEYASSIKDGNISNISDKQADLSGYVAIQSLQKQSREQFDATIAELNQQKAVYKENGDIEGVLKSDASGYFFSYISSGSENVSFDKLDTITATEIESTIKLARESAANTAGRVVSGFEWYYATVMSDEEILRVKEEKTFNLSFPQLSSKAVPATLHTIRKDADGKNIVTFKSNYMVEALLATTAQQCEIILDEYTGIKIPKDAIRENQGKWGVYCLVGEKPVFKEVSWIFETDSYYLVEQAENQKSGLYEYDKIILSPVK